jgi:hypothetical protein
LIFFVVQERGSECNPRTQAKNTMNVSELKTMTWRHAGRGG